MDQKKIGKFIADNRKLKKITQAELGEMLGVTDRTISNWENGKNMPDLSLFKPLCDILEISINELMSGEKLSKEEYKDKLEENFINTIDYIDKRNVRNSDKNNILFLIIGLIGFCLSQLVFKDNELVNYVNVVCMILYIYSLKQLAIKYRFVRRLIALMLVIFCFLIIWLG